jgi:hypothetical protein
MHIADKDINRHIAAEISWSRTEDRSTRTQPARLKFLQRFERELDHDGELSALRHPEERRRSLTPFGGGRCRLHGAHAKNRGELRGVRFGYERDPA